MMAMLNVPRRLHEDQTGLFSVSHVVATLFLTVAAICVFNVGATLLDRTRHQRLADSAAESLGTWKARNINAVVAHQHLMGQLMGLVITHHAIGGDLLDQQAAADTDQPDRELKVAYHTALSCKSGTPAYAYVSRAVLAEEALLKAHLELKRLLTFVYYTKAVATAMQAYPPTRPAGEVLEQIAHVLELAILSEWRTLESIRQVALSLTSFKLEIVHRILPDAKDQLLSMIDGYRQSQQQIAAELESRYHIKIHVLQSDQRLPVVEDPWARLLVPPTHWQPPVDCACPTEPADNMRHQIVKITQLARATFPWVNYHRLPLVERMEPLTPLSHMATHYFDHTNGVSKRMLDVVQRNGDLALWTLDDYQGPDKAVEAWMEPLGSGAADKTFGLSVLIGIPTREPVGSFFFAAQNNAMTYRYASTFMWNRFVPSPGATRIDLNCKRIIPSFQAETAWDTLGWSPGVKVSELVGIGRPHTFPAISPAWTSRLTPTSTARLKELKSQPLPSWATGVRDVLPDQIPTELAAL